ncbi:hypothetical protein M3Y96_00390600 [Aphelenchoides besseyi]|nr:hypothetical protein M3Y96_00390600 [Aphelenchoides besseyi]
MASSRQRSKSQHQASPRKETAKTLEQQNEAAEANRTEFGFNSGWNGLTERLKVGPKILIVHPKRNSRRIIYISNVSNDRQYFKFIFGAHGPRLFVCEFFAATSLFCSYSQ